MSVLELRPEQPVMKFIRDIVPITETDENTGEQKLIKRVVIKLKNCNNGKSRVHKYTDFLGKWVNRKTNTARDVADYIVPFLNYITFVVPYKDLPSIADLNFEIGTQYLNKYGKGKRRTTVIKCEHALTEFYYFLAERKLLKHITKDSFTHYSAEAPNGGSKRCIQSPFPFVEYPQDASTEHLHHLDDELIFMFISVALEVAPRIALGIYFQFFGGLRVSEAANVTHYAITPKGPYCRHGAVISLEERNLRPDLPTNCDSVKKPRTQAVMAIGDLLEYLYRLHFQKYKTNLDAVFIGKNGKAMTSKTYRSYFNKVKHAFIDRLRSSSSPLLQIFSVTLREKRFSTHLGRGVFSNLLGDCADNAGEIASWRGDKNLDSSLSYIMDSRKIEKKVADNLNQLYLSSSLNHKKKG